MRNQLLLIIQLEYLPKRYNICILMIRILLISLQLCFCTTPPLKTFSPLKTPTGSDVYSYRGICFSALFTLLLIPNTPGAVFSTTTTPTGIKNVRVYLAIAIFMRVNIAYKQITKIAKDIQAIDYQLSKLKDSLSEIKDKLTFIWCGITLLIYNTKLLNIKFKQIQVGYYYKFKLIKQ